MDILKDRILKDGELIGSDIIKVDAFLNHQIDVGLIGEIGAEFARRFAALPVTKILTIEASGIALACATGLRMNGLPVLFAKKTPLSTMTDGFYATEVTSFTRRSVSLVAVSQKYLNEDDKLLIIDDIMAHGEATLGLTEIARQAGAEVLGIGVAIDKAYQGGSEKLKEAGFRVESLVVITSMTDGHIVFK
ncbi:MAG TPA: xanthine phosphoribosyltransferase [Clostridiales bacterium]|nr:xanthine phosphoribosyltransferase [Clostridiales bacterium]